MFTNNKLAKSVRLAMAFGAAATALPAAQAVAAEEDAEDIERIQVTGSSIKRTDMEGALPITTLDQDDIIQTGVTSVPDLIAKIPSMQGFQAPSQSVGGGGGGVATASLRGLGGEYTLVLLNGRRLASSASGSSVDINSIPLAAIERVEILSDGASALYGADAIAGVINFILKKDVQETSISARYDAPEESGGSNYTFSITTGFGDLNTDGYNVFASYSRESQEQLASVDREFSKTGFIPLSHNGTDLMFIASSSNAIPGNARVRFLDPNNQDRNGDGRINSLDTYSYQFNPYQAANGSCAANNVPSNSQSATVLTDRCVFDFTSTLEILPEFVRDNAIVGGVLELNDDTEAYATVNYSKFEQIARIAPYPTGNFTLPTDSTLVQNEVLPYIPSSVLGFSQADILSNIYDVAGAWRVLPGGNRTNEFSTDSLWLNFGVRGDFGDISYDFSVTHADNERTDTILTGYPITSQFMALVTSGAVNVFADPSSLTEEETAAVRDTMYNGMDTVTETQLTIVEGQFSAPIFELDAGDVYLGGGFDYRETSYVRNTSTANQQAQILFTLPDPAFDLERESFGAFLEMVVPVTDNFEITGSVRYDEISDIDASSTLYQDNNGDGVNEPNVQAGTRGVTMDDTTYKISLAYRPTDEWLIRASTGTGFKAPTMRQIAEPRIPFGVTGNTYDCPFTGSDPLASFCRAPSSQYDVVRQGNEFLQPEESEQYSIGAVYGSDSFDFSIDYWNIELTNQVLPATEGQIFGNPQQFRELFTTQLDPGTGDQLLAMISASVNVGQATVAGIDYSIGFSNEFGSATLNTNITGTYVTESEYLRAGTGTADTPAIFDTSLGRKGPDDDVVFNNRVRIENTLVHGDFSHSVNVEYQSGWTDENFPGGDSSIRLANDLNTFYSGGVQLQVPSYTTVDYLTRYNYDSKLSVSFGINNLFDRTPPLALGENGGHQEGFDPRYYDVLGRTFYITADYTF